MLQKFKSCSLLFLQRDVPSQAGIGRCILVAITLQEYSLALYPFNLLFSYIEKKYPRDPDDDSGIGTLTGTNSTTFSEVSY